MTTKKDNLTTNWKQRFKEEFKDNIWRQLTAVGVDKGGWITIPRLVEDFIEKELSQVGEESYQVGYDTAIDKVAQVRKEYESPQSHGLSKKDLLRITYQSSADQMKNHEERIRINTIEEIKEKIHKRKVEWHKTCLEDQFINGRFWEAQELWEELHSLSTKKECHFTCTMDGQKDEYLHDETKKECSCHCHCETNKIYDICISRGSLCERPFCIHCKEPALMKACELVMTPRFKRAVDKRIKKYFK